MFRRRLLPSSVPAAVVLVVGACHHCPSPEGSPPALGEGFVDLTSSIEAAPPFTLDPGDASLRRQPEVSAGVIADLDGDGKAEVVLTPTAFGPMKGARAYRLDASGRLAAAASINLPAGFRVMAAVDLDGDGLVDLLGTGAGQVAWGLGQGAFAAPVGLDPSSSVPFGSEPTPYLDDIDGDGWLDVLIGIPCCGGDNGVCRALHPLLRTGARTFVDRADLVPETIPGKPYAVMAADLASGEKVVAQLGWSCVDPENAPVFYRAKGIRDDGYPAFEPLDPAPSADWHSTRGKRKGSMANASPMGAAVADVDGDGAMDLAVMLNADHVVLKGGEAFPFADQSSCTGFVEILPDQGMNPMLPWGAAFVDLDRDGRLDAVIAHGNDNSGWFEPDKFTGPQHATAHWNGGGFAFTDITDAIGLGRRGQWRALTVGDLDGDGDADLIVGGQGELPRVYQNRISAGRGLAVRLRGHTSNALGIGARVDVPASGALPAQHLLMGGIGSPLAVSEPLVFVALGQATSTGLEITWPSGLVQEVKGLAAGAVHEIDEPAILEISPADRHVTSGPATVRVTPRGRDGSPREGAVTLRVAAGAGAVSSPSREGATWVFTISPGASGGSSVIEASIDGEVVRVRPRIFWGS